MDTFTKISQSEAVAISFADVHVWGTELKLGNIMPSIDLAAELAELHPKWRGKNRSEVLQQPDHAPYAKFMKALGVSLKKQLPSVANLIIRALTREVISFPCIHPAVDVVNIAAIQSGVSLGIFDASCIFGELLLAFSEPGDQFQAIGSEDVVDIEPGRLVLRDNEKILSLFSIRDSQIQAITEQTRTICLLGCQVPGVTREKTLHGMELAKNLLVKYQIIKMDGVQS